MLHFRLWRRASAAATTACATPLCLNGAPPAGVLCSPSHHTRLPSPPVRPLLAGWTGFNCLHPMKRYCTHKFRDWGFDPPRLEPNYTEALGPHSPSTFQFTVTHCAGGHGQAWQRRLGRGPGG